MDVVFPNPKNKKKLDIYSESGKGSICIQGNNFNYKSLEFDRNVLKEFYIANHLFEGYEDNMARNAEKKVKNKKSLIMGILNATPDSFFEGSRISGTEIIDSMIDLKPDIIDIGGESTRPGSSEIDPETEFSRVKGVLEYIKSVSNIPVSLDSRHYDTVSRLMNYGVDYINDISGFDDPRMIDLAKENDIKCIVMHMRGTPQNMREFTNYDNLYFQINKFFYLRTNDMINKGIRPENIIIDPGIGFSKDFYGNMDILKSPWSFFLGFDTLFGTSRKGFIGRVTGSSIGSRIGGTVATSIYLNQNGVDILRVHDVEPNRDGINMYGYIADY
jgi:dihydropteroate synthase